VSRYAQIIRSGAGWHGGWLASRPAAKGREACSRPGGRLPASRLAGPGSPAVLDGPALRVKSGSGAFSHTAGMASPRQRPLACCTFIAATFAGTASRPAAETASETIPGESHLGDRDPVDDLNVTDLRPWNGPGPEAAALDPGGGQPGAEPPARGIDREPGYRHHGRECRNVECDPALTAKCEQYRRKRGSDRPRSGLGSGGRTGRAQRAPADGSSGDGRRGGRRDRLPGEPVVGRFGGHGACRGRRHARPAAAAAIPAGEQVLNEVVDTAVKDDLWCPSAGQSRPSPPQPRWCWPQQPVESRPPGRPPAGRHPSSKQPERS
jgi:hypothetical protein